MKNNFKTIFVHGYTASSKADWYPNITSELKKLNIDFIIPDLPGGKYPKVEEWLREMHKEIIKTNKPLVLVGHSLGTRATLLYLEKFKPKIKLAILVAAFANRTENGLRRDGDVYPDFFLHKIEISKIKPLAEKFIVMHSKDDSSIPYGQGVEISRDLNAELRTYEDRDHFTEPENASYVLDVLRKELSF